MTKTTATKQISFRVPINQYEHLQALADKTNQTISELSRAKITSSNRAETLQDELRQLEARLTRKMFLINCAIAGLDRDDIKAANQRYNLLLTEGRQ